MSDKPQVTLDTTKRGEGGGRCEGCLYFYNSSRPDVLRRLFPMERCGYFGSAVEPGDACGSWSARPESTH